MKNTIIAALLFVFSPVVPALAAQQDIAQLSAVTASREALRTAINTQLSAVQSNFDEVYAVIAAGPVYVNASAPADTKVVWIDTDQDNAIKVYVGGVWTVVGTAGSAGDDLGSAAYTDVVALWTTCTGYLKSDGTCDTPSGSATYPSAAGVANWGGSAWGTSYTVGTGASNLVQLNGSAQLPAVSADLLTVTDSGPYFTTDTVGAALNQLGSEFAAMPSLAAGTGITITEDGGGEGIDTIGVTAGTYQAYDANMITWPSTISATEVGYLNGLTEALSTSLSGKQAADAQLDTWAGITPGTGVGTAITANTGAVGGLLTIIASGATAMSGDSVPANTCASSLAVTATGVAATDVIIATPSTRVDNIAGYGVTTAGALRIDVYPTSGNVNFQICNPTGTAIDPDAITVNWKVVR